MTSLSKHQSTKSTKLLLMGNPGTGKTGALAALVKAGYKLRIIDLDNGLDSLAAYIRRDCPDKLDNVEFRTIRDKYKTVTASRTSPIEGTPTAYTEALALLGRWKYDDIDLGKPADWGEDTVVVTDSSTMLGDAMFNWAEFFNSHIKDPRQIYGEAQKAFENWVALITSESFKPNVIMISHIRYSTNADGTMKGFPTAVGSALGPIIPGYFNNVALMETFGSGDAVKRQIRTAPTAMIDLKNPSPFAFTAPLPIETGLADFFKAVRR